MQYDALFIYYNLGPYNLHNATYHCLVSLNYYHYIKINFSKTQFDNTHILPLEILNKTKKYKMY